ncbi:MAG: hypothetical protein MUC48_05275 [Leptolyngbya sp. Prado105]|jgi:hypothetical protein|nr:hypothetical protein [Leptolyngbya sp. Prado105]
MKLLLTCSLIGTAIGTIFLSTPALSREVSPASRPSSRDYIGITYRSNLPQGFQDNGGWVVKGGQYGADIVQHDQTQMLWLGRVLPWQQGGAVPRKVVDVLEFPILTQSQKIRYAFCRLNGIPDREIFAIVEPSNTEFHTNIHQAWRANTKTEKIEPISPEGVTCENLDR